MFARVYSGGLLGVDAYRIEVEVDCGGGMGQIYIVGLPDAAVQESAQRVRSAIKACKFAMTPGHKWVVNLAPGDTRKEGPVYDLPIAAGILAASKFISCKHLKNFWIVGELGLDGSVRPVPGVLPLAFACKQSGASSIIVPEANGYEASLVEGLVVHPVNHLQQVCSILSSISLTPSASPLPLPHSLPHSLSSTDECRENYSEVKGQTRAKRALEIAAAGRHNILLVGPPGAGKSMLAQRLPGIMPPLEFQEALELTKLYSVAGKLPSKSVLVDRRPFRTPHHTSSAAGLIGGGTVPRPGEISLSHQGILFLDELTEFPRRHLDTLRQPLETGGITISRSQQTLSYPASFLFVGACNPCPCGYRGDKVKECICTPKQAQHYWSRISGPLLDRIDLYIEVARPTEDELSKTQIHKLQMHKSQTQESSESMRLRVLRAVEMQKLRLSSASTSTSTSNSPIQYNSQLRGSRLHNFCRIDDATRQRLAKLVTASGLSARAFDGILRVARTIADLSGTQDISWLMLAEALDYRIIKSLDITGRSNNS